MKMQKGFFCSGVLLTWSLLLLLTMPVAGNAATFTVNSTADTAGLQANCVSGTGTCTLRSAIQAANASLAVDDIINLPAGTYTLTIPGRGEPAAATGDLNINGLGGALTITGTAGAAATIIDGGALDGVFQLQAGTGANVTMSGVTVRNGNNNGGLGGGIHVGNGTTLKLSNSVVTANTATGVGAGAGGIDNSGTLNLDNVVVTGNDSIGGGINNGAAGVLTWINGGEVSGNTTGGGIQTNGTITLTNVTISGNTSAAQGAGIDSRGTVTLTNVTLSGNTSTAALNAIGGVRNQVGAVGPITARNTIISGNLPANCGGTITSLGNNIDNGTTCAFAVAGDLASTDPLLAPLLALNGGALIKTRALQPTSPAIDAGSATVFPATDARGIPRPVAGKFPPGTAKCDIGAFEFRPPTITVALPPAVTLPPLFDFGNVFTDVPHNNTVTLFNAGDGPLNIITVATPLAPFSIAANTCTVPLALGESCTVTERFAPTVAGLATGTFNITSNDPVNTTVPVALQGTGSLVPVPGIAVTDSIAPANDNSVPFGNVLLGGSADATITVTNDGTANLVIGQIATANPLAAPFTITGNTCSGATVAPAANCTLTVRFAPTASGAASDTFDIPGTGVPAVTVSLTGTGATSITAGGTGNNPPANPVLISPANNATGVPTTMTFVWKKSADPDAGDVVKYHFMYGTDPNLVGAQTVDVAFAQPAGLLFAGLGSMGAGLLLFGFVGVSGMKRGRKLLLIIPVLLLVGALFTACGGGGGGTTTTPPVTPPAEQVSTTVTGLTANTTYFWKVVADDGKGGLATSDTFTFKTQ
jgi:CSLREA domain-containing protein